MKLMSTADMVSCLLVVPPGQPDQVQQAILDFRDQVSPYDRELVLVVHLIDPGPRDSEQERTAGYFAPMTNLVEFIREHDPDGYAIYRYNFLALAGSDATISRARDDWLKLAADTARGVRLLWWDPAIRHAPDWLGIQGEVG
jgi:hypothetical protein